MFGDAYDRKGSQAAVCPAERPKYGTINLTDDPMGVRLATCYGTSYFVLKENVRWRCTLTSRDSASDYSRPGTPRQFNRFLEEGDGSRLADDELEMVLNHTGGH